MKSAIAETKCPCGAEIKASVKKPKPFSPTVSKISCESCDSKFLLKTEIRGHDDEGKRAMRVSFQILELSQKAADVIHAPAEPKEQSQAW